MKTLTIGQVARQAGIGVETVRFYERQGLLEEPTRKASGYREYTEDVVRRLRFIRRAKELGFSLKEVRELLTLRLDPDATAADVKRRAEAKLADIEARIRDLRRMKEALVELAAACSGHGPASECPILGALDGTGATWSPAARPLYMVRLMPSGWSPGFSRSWGAKTG
jgi:MerR family mercuric resistance operon transcriptional regulator